MFLRLLLVALIIIHRISPQLIFYVDTYFNHFKDAVKKYRDELLGIIITPNINGLQTNFDQAYESLEIYKSPSGMANVSGGVAT